MSLEEVDCFKMGRAIGYHELAVLPTRLYVCEHVNAEKTSGETCFTKTMPEPHRPDHLPPINEIQFRWPKGVGPTEIFGLS